MDILPPIEALKGPALNALVDHYSLHGFDRNGDLAKQHSELLYILGEQIAGEVRMTVEELRRFHAMLNQLKAEETRRRPQELVEPVVSEYQKLLQDTSQSLWHRNLIQETLNQ